MNKYINDYDYFTTALRLYCYIAPPPHTHKHTHTLSVIIHLNLLNVVFSNTFPDYLSSYILDIRVKIKI